MEEGFEILDAHASGLHFGKKRAQFAFKNSSVRCKALVVKLFAQVGVVHVGDRSANRLDVVAQPA